MLGIYIYSKSILHHQQYFYCCVYLWGLREIKEIHKQLWLYSSFFFFLPSSSKSLFIYLFIYGCVGSLFLCEGCLQLRQAGATPHRGARASHLRGLSRCGAQAPDAQAQQLWLMGPVAPRDVGSSQTRARTHVPRTGRQTLNHCATREVLLLFL